MAERQRRVRFKPPSDSRPSKRDYGQDGTDDHPAYSAIVCQACGHMFGTLIRVGDFLYHKKCNPNKGET